MIFKNFILSGFRRLFQPRLKGHCDHYIHHWWIILYHYMRNLISLATRYKDVMKILEYILYTPETDDDPRCIVGEKSGNR